MSSVYLNDAEVGATYGLNMTSLGEVLDQMMAAGQMIEIPGLAGAIGLGPYMTPVREFQVEGYLDGASQSVTRGNLQKLGALFADGNVVRFRMVDWTTVQLLVQCHQFEALNYPTNSRANSQHEIPIAIRLHLRSVYPYPEDVSASTVSFTATPTAVPQGSAPSQGILESTTGTTAEDVITCKAYDGTVLWACTLAPRSSSEKYRINLRRGVMSLEVWNGSAWLPADDRRTAGIFPKPLWCTPTGYAASQWPTLEATAGNWTYTYHKAWR